MIKRLVYVIVLAVVFVFAYITFLPCLFLAMLWLILEVIVWIITNKNILKDPFDVLEICFWGSSALDYVEKKLNNI